MASSVDFRDATRISDIPMSRVYPSSSCSRTPVHPRSGLSYRGPGKTRGLGSPAPPTRVRSVAMAVHTVPDQVAFVGSRSLGCLVVDVRWHLPKRGSTLAEPQIVEGGASWGLPPPRLPRVILGGPPVGGLPPPRPPLCSGALPPRDPSKGGSGLSS